MNRWHDRLAVAVLRRGGVIACPTEAVYGLSCLAGDRRAVERILCLKRRPASKGLIVVAAAEAQLADLVDLQNSPFLEQIRASWPGPVSWILPRDASVPYWLSGDHSGLAVRVTAHPRLAELCRACGPLVSTSANLAGTAPARDALRVRAYFGDRLDHILPGPTGGAGAPSMIRDGCSGEVLRSGG